MGFSPSIAFDPHFYVSQKVQGLLRFSGKHDFKSYSGTLRLRKVELHSSLSFVETREKYSKRLILAKPQQPLNMLIFTQLKVKCIHSGILNINKHSIMNYFHVFVRLNRFYSCGRSGIKHSMLFKGKQ